MSKYEREILQAVAMRGRIDINELAGLLGVTDQTVRRIIKPLVDRGEIKKVHGAILNAQSAIDPPFIARMGLQQKEKLAIAGEVAGLIRDGSTVAIDTGSTSAYIAQALRQHNDLTIVTNSAFVASTLSMVPGNKVFMAGTQLRNHDGAAFDCAAFDVINSMHADYAVLSASCVHPRRGFLVQEQCEVDISQAMMTISDRRIIAVDHSKFGNRHASLSLPPLLHGDFVVTDEAPGDDFSDLLAEQTLICGSR